ncbi:hypothetical protein HaLaN_23582, partial [Haematococcus lacustris]
MEQPAMQQYLCPGLRPADPSTHQAEDPAAPCQQLAWCCGMPICPPQPYGTLASCRSRCRLPHFPS